MKTLLFGTVLLLAVACPLPELTAAPSAPPEAAPSNAAGDSPVSPPAGESQAGQAPIEVIKKLSDLVHAGNYSEAQQLTTGLLLAYPDDQRLVRARALLQKYVAAQSTGQAGAAHPPATAAGSPATATSAAPASPAPDRQPDGFVGIGVSLEADSDSHGLKIGSVFQNSPASRAGLSPGMLVSRVDHASTQGMTLEEVAKLLQGAAGTKVELGLTDLGTGRETTFLLTREMILYATDTDPSQLSGMDKIDYEAMIELAKEAQQTADADQQKASLGQFMRQSLGFLTRHPHEMVLWQFRAAAAISLNDPVQGYIAGQKLIAAGAANGDDQNALALLAQLRNKGWLDWQEARKHAMFDWVLGTWSITYSLSWHGRGTWPANFGPVNRSGSLGTIDFAVNGSRIEGYSTVDGNKAFVFTGVPSPSGEIRWYKWYNPAGSQPGYHAAIWGWKPGETYYPNGWLPVISCAVGEAKGTMTMVVPSQDKNPASRDPMSDTVTLVLTKVGSSP